MSDLDRAIDAAHKWRAVTASYTMDGMTDGEIALVNLLAAIEAQEPAAWVDEFGNAYPLAAYNGSGTWRDAHKRHWRRAYLAPVAPARCGACRAAMTAAIAAIKGDTK